MTGGTSDIGCIPVSNEDETFLEHLVQALVLMVEILLQSMSQLERERERERERGGGGGGRSDE